MAFYIIPSNSVFILEAFLYWGFVLPYHNYLPFMAKRVLNIFIFYNRQYTHVVHELFTTLSKQTILKNMNFLFLITDTYFALVIKCLSLKYLFHRIPWFFSVRCKLMLKMCSVSLLIEDTEILSILSMCECHLPGFHLSYILLIKGAHLKL